MENEQKPEIPSFTFKAPIGFDPRKFQIFNTANFKVIALDEDGNNLITYKPISRSSITKEQKADIKKMLKRGIYPFKITFNGVECYSYEKNVDGFILGTSKPSEETKRYFDELVNL